jgi:hypothetical protein
MSLLDSPWLGYLGAALSLLICGLTWLVLRLHQQRIKLLEQTLSALQSQLAMASDSGIGVGRKVVAMERRLHATEQKQKEIESTDLQKVSYNEAVRLIGMGAEVDDLVTSCGLTRAEANLLQTLHASQYRVQLKQR